jgi:hypothetical protein
VPSAFGCRRTLWPVGPGHCGLDGAPSSMVVKPVTSCRGPTSQRVPLNPGKPELAWWTTSSMAFGRGCGKRSDRVAHYRAPGRRLGALVEGLSHGPDGIATRKTTRSAKHAQNRCWGRAQKGAHTPVSGAPESMSMGAVGSNRWLLGADVGPSVAAVVARGLSGPGVTS